MDTGKGNFEMLAMQSAKAAQEVETIAKAKAELEAKHPNHGGWFKVGDVIEIRGSYFRVKSVKPDELRLKLLPKPKSE